AGEQLLRAPYEAWYRWADAPATLGGAFTYRLRRQHAGKPDQYDDFAMKGRFTADADGKVAVEGEQGADANPKAEIAAALQNVRRPAFAELAQRNKLVPVGGDRVALRGPGWTWNHNASSAKAGATSTEVWNDLQVAGDRIVSDGFGDGERTQW